MSKSTLEKVIAALSYSPALFGIFFLMTSRETEDSYEDKSGVSGILAGLACIAYGLCAGAASSGCPADFCKVLVLARLALGVISLLAGIFILALGDETDKALKFVLMYIFFALMTVPEAGTFYMYVRQVQLEKFMAENAEPQLQAQQQWPPRQAGANVPQFSGGGFGYGVGGVAAGGDFGLGAPNPGAGPSMGSAAPQHAPSYT